MIYQMLLSKKIKKYSPMKSVFIKTGYRPITKIGTTLQGSVYTGMFNYGTFMDAYIYMCLDDRKSVYIDSFYIYLYTLQLSIWRVMFVY